MIVDFKGRIISRHDYGAGSSYCAGAIDIEALRDFRARSPLMNWMKDLRTEVLQLIYAQPIYPKNLWLRSLPMKHSEYREKVIDVQIRKMFERRIWSPPAWMISEERQVVTMVPLTLKLVGQSSRVYSDTYVDRLVVYDLKKDILLADVRNVRSDEHGLLTLKLPPGREIRIHGSHLFAPGQEWLTLCTIPTIETSTDVSSATLLVSDMDQTNEGLRPKWSPSGRK